MIINKGLINNFGDNFILFRIIEALIPIPKTFFKCLFHHEACNLFLDFWIFEWFFSWPNQCGSGVCIPFRCLVDDKQKGFLDALKSKQLILMTQGEFETCNRSNSKWTYLILFNCIIFWNVLKVFSSFVSSAI